MGWMPLEEYSLLVKKILAGFLVSCGPFILGVLNESILYPIPVMELIFQPPQRKNKATIAWGRLTSEGNECHRTEQAVAARRVMDNWSSDEVKWGEQGNTCK